MGESLLSFSEVLLFGRLMDDLIYDPNHANKPDGPGSGAPTVPPKNTGNQLLDTRLGQNSRFARIYGFSFEGTYYELPSPTVFLVHGGGQLVSAKQHENAPNTTDPSKPSRAPRSPDFGGVAAADFQFADDIRVWSYDKADYTIRMDVATGMLEQVLLEPTFSDIDATVSGAKVSGAKVSGAKVSGAKVSGAKVSGAKVSGAKARGPSD